MKTVQCETVGESLLEKALQVQPQLSEIPMKCFAKLSSVINLNSMTESIMIIVRLVKTKFESNYVAAVIW